MQRLTREQSRAADRIAIDELGIPGIVLMENAARNAAEIIHRFAAARRALIVCGSGNNAGDGYGVARHLLRLGWSVNILALKPIADLTGDAKTMATIAQRLKIPITNDPAIIDQYSGATLVDAITGTGLTSPLRAAQSAIVERINACAFAHVIAIDLPSGIDCDTGKPLGATIRANQTVTFIAEKAGFVNPESKQYTGEIFVADIGVLLLDSLVESDPFT